MDEDRWALMVDWNEERERFGKCGMCGDCLRCHEEFHKKDKSKFCWFCQEDEIEPVFKKL